MDTRMKSLYALPPRRHLRPIPQFCHGLNKLASMLRECTLCRRLSSVCQKRRLPSRRLISLHPRDRWSARLSNLSIGNTVATLKEIHYEENQAKYALILIYLFHPDHVHFKRPSFAHDTEPAPYRPFRKYTRVESSSTATGYEGAFFDAGLAFGRSFRVV